MTELRRFGPRLARLQSLPFDFDRASVRLLAQRWPLRRYTPSDLDVASEWRDPRPLAAITGSARRVG